MKKVLITGGNSYIGTSVEQWLNKSPEQFEVTTISVRGEEWKQHNFSKYDSIFHVAGIAHIKETKQNQHLYYAINYELVKEIAIKAKDEGVNQFIFLSSMSVYGKDTGTISFNTVPNPRSAYGESKLKAEDFLKSISSEQFKVSIVRPPMVYGSGCKGNYQLLSNMAKKIPVFVNYKNKRSMIYIDNLSSFIELVLIHQISGIFHPQNLETVSTTKLVQKISEPRKVYLISVFNPLVYLATKKIKLFKKVFGDLYYDSTTIGYPNSEYKTVKFSYNHLGFTQSIKRTENGA